MKMASGTFTAKALAMELACVKWVLEKDLEPAKTTKKYSAHTTLILTLQESHRINKYLS